jgi:hypothetical protein
MYHHLYPALAHDRMASLCGAASASRAGRRNDQAIEQSTPRIAAVSRLRRLITTAP